MRFSGYKDRLNNLGYQKLSSHVEANKLSSQTHHLVSFQDPVTSEWEFYAKPINPVGVSEVVPTIDKLNKPEIAKASAALTIEGISRRHQWFLLLSLQPSIHPK